MDQTGISFNNASIATPIYNSKMSKIKKEVTFKDYFATTLAVGNTNQSSVTQLPFSPTVTDHLKETQTSFPSGTRDSVKIMARDMNTLIEENEYIVSSRLIEHEENK